MIPRTVLLLFVLLALVGNAEAQTSSITLGEAVLRLGMSEAEVRAELAKHPSLFLLTDGGISNKLPEDAALPDYLKGLYSYGEVSFKQGRLNHIEKHWRPSVDSPDTALVIASALYGATFSVAGTTPKLCRVYTWTDAEPDEDYKETTIECDAPGVARGVHVFIKTFHFGEKEDNSVQVSETLDTR